MQKFESPRQRKIIVASIMCRYNSDSVVVIISPIVHNSKLEIDKWLCSTALH